METKTHWDKVYTTKQPDEVSWYRKHLDMSLALIAGAVPNLDAHIIDVGGGEATLVDDLHSYGYRYLCVLDISKKALDVAQARLGRNARNVRWLCDDVTSYPFEQAQFDVWHDRAVFHFLTDDATREAYVRQVIHAVKPGGHVIVATFGPEGPTKRSGLEVVRYDADRLHDQFGTAFRLVDHRTELHQTPSGAIQQFVYCYCRFG